MPPRLGYTPGIGEPFVPLEEQVEVLPPGQSLRVAIVNSLANRFGDAIMSLRLLRELRARLEVRFESVAIDLLQHGENPETDRLYRRSGLIRAVRLLPLPLASLAEYDAYLDFSRAPMRPDVHWLDDFLERTGIDPRDVPPSRKRSWLPPDPDAERRLEPHVRPAKQGGRPVVLFHPQASDPAHSLPPPLVAELVRGVLDRTGWLGASAVPVPVEHPAFLDWSGLSRRFEDFVYLVSRADLLVSVDTCAYHVADAFGVPAVVLFTNVPPEHRIAYYPYTEGIARAFRGGEGGWDEGRAPSRKGPDVETVLAALQRVTRKRYGAGHPGESPVHGGPGPDGHLQAEHP
jgi:hypothetical protein